MTHLHNRGGSLSNCETCSSSHSSVLRSDKYFPYSEGICPLFFPMKCEQPAQTTPGFRVEQVRTLLCLLSFHIVAALTNLPPYFAPTPGKIPHCHPPPHAPIWISVTVCGKDLWVLVGGRELPLATVYSPLVGLIDIHSFVVRHPNSKRVRTHHLIPWGLYLNRSHSVVSCLLRLWVL